MDTSQKKLLKAYINDVYGTAVSLRRAVHADPEISGNEVRTASLIYNRLSELGLKPRYLLGKTAVLAFIRNGKGPLTALRADTDALPIQEETGLPFCSKNPGIMHACGHDMHTAALLGAAEVLIRSPSMWRGTVLLVFQPCEETEPGGAYSLLRNGCIPENTDAIFGLHVSTAHRSGYVGIKEGVDYSGTMAFDVVVKGKGGHGAYPETTVDPIVCSSFMITQLQTLVSRENSPLSPAVVSVGTIHSGTLRNIIPDTASFQGTIRCHSKQGLEKIASGIDRMLKATAESFRASVEISFKKVYPPTVNNSDLIKKFTNTFDKKSIIIRSEPTMIAEDFGFYQEKFPGLYIHLGVATNSRQCAGIHTSKFNPDESSLKTGIMAHCAFVMGMNTDHFKITLKG
jgi:amidohydrolase